MAAPYTAQELGALSSDDLAALVTQARGNTPNNKIPWADPTGFDPTYIPPGVSFSQADWNTLVNACRVQIPTQDWADPGNFLQMASTPAIEIMRQLFLPIETPASADLLCRSGLSYPLAVEIARQINVGTGRVDYLMGMGMSADTAKAIANAITICRSGIIPAGLKPPGS